MTANKAAAKKESSLSLYKMPEAEDEEEEEGEQEQEVVQPAPNSVVENSTDEQVQTNGSSADGVFQQAPINGHKRKNEESLEQLEARTREEEEECIDTTACPICMEPWTNTGDHRICCLPCGHLFGSSCITRWLQQSGTRKFGGKCPQCNKKARKQDVRPLFVPRVLAVVDGEVQKLSEEVHHLRNENHFLKAKNAKLQKQIEENKLEQKMGPARFSPFESFNHPPPRSAAMTDLDLGSYHLAGSDPRRSGVVVVPSRNSRFWPVDDPLARSSQPNNTTSAWCASRWGNTGSDPRLTPDAQQGGAAEPEDRFVRQSEVPLLGGKVFDMDADSQTVMFSNKIEGGGSSRFGLCKMSLLGGTAIEQIDLPPDLGAIRDIRLSTNFGFGGPGKLALVASIGKRRLSVVSMETNNLVHSYDVKSPPWSCSWDPHTPHLMYSGVQNGSVIVLDLRQTSTPVATIEGCSNRPVHTLHVLPDRRVASRTGAGDPILGNTELLSASVAGIFHWSLTAFDSASSSSTSGPKCIFSAKEKFCTSLAYDSSIDTAVASFRRAPQLVANDPSSTGQNLSQSFDGPSASKPPLAVLAQEDPSHWIFKRGLATNNNPRGSRMGEASSSTSNSSSSSPGNAAPWQWVGEMAGHKSQSTMMPRGAIVSKWRATPGSKAWFAGGDEGTNAVWLWDMDTFRVTQTLLPHESAVLDIKHVHSHGKDVLGCLSDRTFQLYRRQPRSC